MMICKFPGKCARCNGLIQEGEDCSYDSVKKKISHHNCPTAGAGESAEQLAERLGYRHVPGIQMRNLPGAAADEPARDDRDARGWHAVPRMPEEEIG